MTTSGVSRARSPVYRAAQAMAAGDVGTARSPMPSGRSSSPRPDDHTHPRIRRPGFLALAYWAIGDLAGGAPFLGRVRSRTWSRAGHIADMIGYAHRHGRYPDHPGSPPRRDEPPTSAACDLVAEPGAARAPRGGRHARRHEPRCLVERGRPRRRAPQHLRAEPRPSASTLGLAQNPYRWRVAMARIRQAEGDLAAIARAARRGRSPVRRATTSRTSARSGALQGPAAGSRSGTARPRRCAWAREQGLSADDDLTYLREYEHITLARILLAGSEQRPVPTRSARRRRQPPRAPPAGGGLEGERTRQRHRDPHPAGACLRAARRHCRARWCRWDVPSTLAEPEGYVRIFVDEGAPLVGPAPGSREARRRPEPTSARLLAAFGRAQGRRPADQALVEPLSERELDVLRLLATDLDGPDDRPRARRVAEHGAHATPRTSTPSSA